MSALAERPRKNFRRSSQALQVGLSLVILLLVLKYVDPSLIGLALQRISLLDLVAALVVAPIALLPRVWRWSAIINRSGSVISFGNLFQLTLVGVSLNFVVPASMGEVAKSYYGYKLSGLKEEMLSSTLIDKFMALASVFAIGGAAALAVGYPSYAAISTVLCLAFGILALAPTIIPWGAIRAIPIRALHRVLSIEKLRSAYSLPAKTKLIALIWSVTGWLVTYLGLLLLFRAFSVDMPFIYVLTFAPVIVLARILPLTFSGLGTQEAAMVYFFGTLGVSSADAFLVSVVFTLIYSIVPALAGIAVLSRFITCPKP